MRDINLNIRPVDFSKTTDVDCYLELLDAYANDPMGIGQSLTAEKRCRLAADLASNPTAHCLLAEHAGQAIGVTTCFLGYSTFQARPLLNIHDLAVLPGWRGRGVAGQLLAAITELAVDLNCCRVTLEVREDNPRALQAYQHAGFMPGQCSLFMAKEL